MLSLLIDPYSRTARLAPALIVILPAALLASAWFSAQWQTIAGLVSIATALGFLVLLSQVARDRGKKLEHDLFATWGGKPSVALLRHSDNTIDPHTKARYRVFLAKKLAIDLPSKAEENSDPAAADEKYDSCSSWLLSQTRDVQTFGVLFRENVSYGFRRNLLGLKPVGASVAIVSSALSVGAMVLQKLADGDTANPLVFALTVVTIGIAGFWVCGVTRAWVRVPADAFGKQLLAACDTLDAKDDARGKR